jgi:hypothetical protein
MDLSSPISLRSRTLELIASDIAPRATKGSDAQKADFARRVSWLEGQAESFWSDAIANYAGAPGNGRVFPLDITEAMNFLRRAPRT